MSTPSNITPDSGLIARQLPPSAATLTLWALDDGMARMVPVLRPDVRVDTTGVDADAGENRMDAVVGSREGVPTEAQLAAYLRALRPGGRLIIVIPRVHPGDALVQALERSGYTRILVEGAGAVTLLRGEKPHTTDDTQARVRIALEREAIPTVADPPDNAAVFTPFDAAAYSGRYVFLLVRQTPNKPPWALQPGDVVKWMAVGLAFAPALAVADENPSVALAFSSLPRAVAFMQPAVHRVVGVSRIAKFTREAAAVWAFTAWLNPPPEALDAAPLTGIAVDPATAVTGDE